MEKRNQKNTAQNKTQTVLHNSKTKFALMKAQRICRKSYGGKKSIRQDKENTLMTLPNRKRKPQRHERSARHLIIADRKPESI